MYAVGCQGSQVNSIVFSPLHSQPRSKPQPFNIPSIVHLSLHDLVVPVLNDRELVPIRLQHSIPRTILVAFQQPLWTWVAMADPIFDVLAKNTSGRPVVFDDLMTIATAHDAKTGGANLVSQMLYPYPSFEDHEMKFKVVPQSKNELHDGC
jgi:hypothetical protein